MIKQEQLKSIREKYSLTQEQLAKMLCLSLRSVVAYEANEQKCSKTALELLKYKLRDIHKSLKTEQKKYIL